MKRTHLAAYFAVIAVVAMMTPTTRAGTPAPQSDPQKNGYSIGYDIGRSLKRQLVDVDVESIAHGMKDGLTGTAPALPEAEMKKRYATLLQESARKIAERNKQEGEAFLAKNKSAKGVNVTASGLQYKVLKAGKGKKPAADDTVTVHYRGTLVDGTEFDSSLRRGQPATFPVNGVIRGWTEALQLMPEGSKWMLYIPANLAYGERGAGPLIGPNSALVFEVELLSIAKKAP